MHNVNPKADCFCGNHEESLKKGPFALLMNPQGTTGGAPKPFL